MNFVSRKPSIANGSPYIRSLPSHWSRRRHSWSTYMHRHACNDTSEGAAPIFDGPRAIYASPVHQERLDGRSHDSRRSGCFVRLLALYSPRLVASSYFAANSCDNRPIRAASVCRVAALAFIAIRCILHLSCAAQALLVACRTHCMFSHRPSMYSGTPLLVSINA